MDPLAWSDSYSDAPDRTVSPPPPVVAILAAVFGDSPVGAGGHLLRGGNRRVRAVCLVRVVDAFRRRNFSRVC